MESEFSAKINNFLALILALVLTFFVIIEASSGIFDTDIWLHLKTGKLIVDNHKVMPTDPYSLIASGKVWNNHEWLFQVLVYLAYHFFSINGLVFLQVLLIALAFLLLFLMGFRDNRRIITTALLSLLVIYATHTRFNLRPELLSLIFFTIFLHHLRFNKDSRILYSLVFWQLLWVNCHGYFFLGPLLVAIYILAELIRRHVPYLVPAWRAQEHLDDLAFSRLKKVFLLLLLVLFFNPRWVIGAIYPLRILSDIVLGRAHQAFQNIEELVRPYSFKGASFTGQAQLSILLLTTFLILLFTWRTLDIASLLLCVFFIPFGIVALRNISFLSFVLYVVIISRLDDLDKIFRKRVKIQSPSKKFDSLLQAAAIGILIWFLASNARSSLYRHYYDFDNYEMKSALLDTIDYRYPKRCLDFLLKNRLPRNLFNDFNSGAYLIFHAWPRYKVFIDGRTEVYSNEFFSAYTKIMEGDRKIFDSYAKRYNLNTVFLNDATAFIPKEVFKMLYEHPFWQLVFFDDPGVIFVKKAPENKYFIDSLAIDLKKWKAPPVDIRRLALTRIAPDPYLNRARLLDCVGLDEPLISEAIQALKVSPSSPIAHFYLGKVFFKQGRWVEALEHLRLAYIYGDKDIDNQKFLAKAYLKLGEKERALGIFKRIAKSKKDDKEVKEFIANINKK